MSRRCFFYIDGEIQEEELLDDKWKIHCRRSTSHIIPQNLLRELKKFIAERTGTLFDKKDFRFVENWKLKPGVALGYPVSKLLDSQDVFQGYLIVHF